VSPFIALTLTLSLSLTPDPPDHLALPSQVKVDERYARALHSVSFMPLLHFVVDNADDGRELDSLTGRKLAYFRYAKDKPRIPMADLDAKSAPGTIGHRLIDFLQIENDWAWNMVVEELQPHRVLVGGDLDSLRPLMQR
jgi:hypothetical protein